ncbi:PQQ-binding-like beta-propeller repeat protein [Gordonia amicalis]|uniref:outer membrane protein assembly factor BamB family protein n=1 Tax=Gordonia amicalis TaxID=89053 RepID=UPI0022B3CD7E|nr:PQQ-binding-like beta-propeller repeat protein [Gordonia amicalis]MCZ4650131.1 PQQ-binding-like beta-propeller repeat protein [Gordonia amicalis]
MTTNDESLREVEPTAVDAPDGSTKPRRGRNAWGLGMLAVSVGFAVGAVGLSLYAVIRLAETGVLGVDTGPALVFLGSALAGVFLGAMSLVVLVVVAVRGKRVVGCAAWLLACACIAIVPVMSGAVTASARHALHGTDSSTSVTLARAAVVVVAVAFAVLVVGAALSSGRLSPRTISWVPAVVVVVVVLAFGLQLTASTPPAGYRTASEVAAPALPTTVGESAVQWATIESQADVVAAGAGFVIRFDREVVGYDGATGRVRWVVPSTALAGGCDPEAIWSSGIGERSTVLITCADELHRGHVVAIDASTGTVRWTRRAQMEPRTSVATPESSVAVVSSRSEAPAEFGVLDLYSGDLLWSTVTKCRYLDGNVTSTNTALVMLNHCESGSLDARTRAAAVTLFDVKSGKQSTIDLPEIPGLRNGDFVMTSLQGSYGDRVVVHMYAHDDFRPRQSVIVDVTIRSVEVVPDAERDYSRFGLMDRDLLLPGPIVPLRYDVHGVPGGTLLVDLGTGLRREIEGVVHYLGETEAVIPTQRWSRVGEDIVGMSVGDSGFRSWDRWLAIVDPAGQVTRRPSPCGEDAGGVLVVPGSVLATCVRDDRERRDTERVDVLALR